MTLRPGKLPPALLGELLAGLSADPSLMLGPGIGRDAALIDLGDRMLVATTDPITFAAEDIGWYAVQVNANDIACMGARPRWMLATLLLPPGAPDDMPSRIMRQMTAAATPLGVTIVGGHSEVTVGLERPIVSATMLGEARHDQIVSGEGVAGDAVLLTKAIAIEGTALLAREAPRRLARTGMSLPDVDAAAAMLFDPGISIVKDAQAICAAARPRALHDPTEGGIATALTEMSMAVRARLRIERRSIPIDDRTRTVCELLTLDPLGLLASGSLLAIIDPSDLTKAQHALDACGISSAVIGRVVGGEPGVIMADDSGESPFPTFDRDELARFLDDAIEHGTPEGSDA